MRLPERSRRESCLSDLRLDQVLVGEIERGRVQLHLDACVACRNRLDDLARDRATFQSRPPQLRRPAALRFRSAAFAVVAAAAVVALFVASRKSDDPITTRTKGKPHVGFFVKHDSMVREGAAREAVNPGDAIEVSYTSDAPRYLAILSRDATGHTSVYFPDRPEAAAVAAGRDQLLPQSTVLDAALGEETLYALFCDRPVALVAILAHPAPPDGCTLEPFAVLVKSSLP